MAPRCARRSRMSPGWRLRTGQLRSKDDAKVRAALKDPAAHCGFGARHGERNPIAPYMFSGDAAQRRKGCRNGGAIDGLKPQQQTGEKPCPMDASRTVEIDARVQGIADCLRQLLNHRCDIERSQGPTRILSPLRCVLSRLHPLADRATCTNASAPKTTLTPSTSYPAWAPIQAHLPLASSGESEEGYRSSRRAEMDFQDGVDVSLLLRILLLEHATAVPRG